MGCPYSTMTRLQCFPSVQLDWHARHSFHHQPATIHFTSWLSSSVEYRVLGGRGAQPLLAPGLSFEPHLLWDLSHRAPNLKDGTIMPSLSFGDLLRPPNSWHISSGSRRVRFQGHHHPSSHSLCYGGSNQLRQLLAPCHKF
jgi:hypothetical protein